MVRVPPENVKLIAYKETVQAFGSAQAEPGQRIAFAFMMFLARIPRPLWSGRNRLLLFNKVL